MDKLFDSVNGSTAAPTVGKDLRCAVTKTSGHWSFWNNALRILGSMKFICRQNHVVSIKNWIVTIKGIQYLSKKLLAKGFDFVVLRNLNQDSIENLYCSVRSHGVRNINPTCSGFISSFKSLLINNLTATHSVGANCEVDNSEDVLDSLKEFVLLNNYEETVKNLEEEQYDCNITTQIISDNINQIPSIVQKNTRSYVTGWVIKKIKPFLNNCKICQYKLTSNKFLNEHNFINVREYDKSKLNYPTSESTHLYTLVIHFFNMFISDFIAKPNLQKHLISNIKNYIDIQSLNCPKHDLQNIFLNASVRLLIFSYVKEINYILNKGENNTKDSLNTVKIAALKYTKTYKTKKIKINLMKCGRD